MKFPATGMPCRPMPPEMGAGLHEAVSARASERLSDGRLDSHCVLPTRAAFPFPTQAHMSRSLQRSSAIHSAGSSSGRSGHSVTGDSPTKPSSACTTAWKDRVEWVSSLQHRETVPKWRVPHLWVRVFPHRGSSATQRTAIGSNRVLTKCEPYDILAHVCSRTGCAMGKVPCF